jgi:outer membrane protein
VAEQLASAQRNFEVGTATITDTREAQAKADLVKAQEIAADNDLRIKKMALDQFVGKEAQAQALATPLVLPTLAPADIDFWVQQSEAQNPTIRQAQAALEVAALEVQKAQAGHKPTLDLAASYNRTNNPSGTLQSGVSTRATNTSVGLQFNLPLFAGFATQNRVRETLALQEKAQSELEGAKRSVAQATRTAYYGVLSGQSQVKALEAAELSSQSALEANQLGYQVGVRVNSDVLNTQSQLFQTKRDLAQARYNVLLSGLKLRQASGTLSANDLTPINTP